MKTLTALSGYCLAIFVFSSLFIYCKKPADFDVHDESFFVIATSPKTQEINSRYDDEVTATLTISLDTNKYIAKIVVSKIDTITDGILKTKAAGKIHISEQTISFTTDEELQPSYDYEASLHIYKKTVDAEPVYTYEWNFTTKEPDSYKMSLRSEHVTDFARDGTRSMQIGNYLYSFGGWRVPEESFNDVYRSSGNLSQWEKLPDAPWHGRHEHGIVSLNGFTYVIGGDYLQPRFDVWRTANGEQWTLMADNILSNRVLYGCTAHNGYIYVVGGAGYTDVWRSRDGASWELVNDYVPFLKGASYAGSLISFRGKLWMVCGGTDGYGSGEILKEVWSSIDGKKWIREKDFVGNKRYYNDMVVWDNKLWVVGGYNHEEGNIKSIWFMKPNGNWEKFETPDDYTGRHATALAVFNNQLSITCGNYQNNCWVIEKVK